jgi:hypothetical protein
MYIQKLESNLKEGVTSKLRPVWYWHHTTDEFRAMWADTSAGVGDKNNVDIGKMEDNSDHSSDVEVREISSFSIRGRSAASALDKVMKETKEEEIMITFKEESIAIPGELIQPTATSSVPVVEVDKALTGQIEDDRTEEEVVNDNMDTMEWFTSASSSHASPPPHLSYLPSLTSLSKRIDQKLFEKKLNFIDLLQLLRRLRIQRQFQPQRQPLQRILWIRQLLGHGAS